MLRKEKIGVRNTVTSRMRKKNMKKKFGNQISTRNLKKERLLLHKSIILNTGLIRTRIVIPLSLTVRGTRV